MQILINKSRLINIFRIPLMSRYNTMWYSFEAGWWFSPGTPIFPTNKTDRHDITEILLKWCQTHNRNPINIWIVDKNPCKSEKDPINKITNSDS